MSPEEKWLRVSLGKAVFLLLIDFPDMMDRLVASESSPEEIRGFEVRPLRSPRCFVRLCSCPSSQFKSVTSNSNHLVRFRSTSPRKNLPPSISRKRAEANFLCSFERAFVAGHCQTKQITWRDFALQGYGIPDLITFAWSTQQNQATVLSLEALRQKLQRQQFTAFELKLRDWRKGIVQAYRYRYFCDSSIVVLPRVVAEKATKRLELFASLDVGLWSFDPDIDVITKYFTPHQGTARNLEARNKAIESILSKIQFCKALK